MDNQDAKSITKEEAMACLLVGALAPSEHKANGRGIPCIIPGKPGTGKTSIIREFAQMVGVPFYSFAVGLRGEGALGVTPVYSEDADAIVYPTPSWVAPFMSKDAKGIILVDELNTARRDLQPPLLALALDKMLGDDKFGPNVRFFGAQNPVGEGGADSHEIAAALANRFCHFPSLRITSEERKAHLGSYKPYGVDSRDEFVSDDEVTPVDLEALEAQVDANFMRVKDKWFPVLCAFLERMPQYVHTMPDENDIAASMAWASDRSWKMALNLIVTAEILGLDDKLRDILIEGCVGAAPTIAFVEYASKLDIPNAADLLDGKIEWSHDPVRPDITGAVLSEIVRVLRPEPGKTPPYLPERMDRAQKAWEILGDVSESAAELVHRPGRELMARKLYKPQWKGVKQVHKKTGAMLSVAGLLKGIK